MRSPHLGVRVETRIPEGPVDDLQEVISRDGSEEETVTETVERPIRIVRHGSEQACIGSGEDVRRVPVLLNRAPELPFGRQSMFDHDGLQFVDDDDRGSRRIVGEPVDGVEGVGQKQTAAGNPRRIGLLGGDPAPAAGLEPATQRLTAACSTN